MRTSLAIATLIALVHVPVTTAHSWLECTDYRFTPGSTDSKIWNKAQCFGRARCGKRQADEGFGVDTGLNYHSAHGCQCARGSDNYQGIPQAVYTPGQRVCVAYPPKNHVAAPCTNEYIPDSGTVITRTNANPTSDDAFVKEYGHGNGQHESGKVDYKGFQNCPNFCADKERSLCTMCFDLESDIAPGDYTFKWTWSFNSKDDAYSTCWEAKVVTENGGSPVAPAPAPGPEAAPAAIDSPSVAPTYPSQGDDDECEDGPDVPVSYEDSTDCEDGPDVPVNYPTLTPENGNEESEDCEEDLPVPGGPDEPSKEYDTPQSAPAPVYDSPESAPAPAPAYGSPESAPAPAPVYNPVPIPAPVYNPAPVPAPVPSSVLESGQASPTGDYGHDVSSPKCAVEDDEDQGPGVVQAYPSGN